MKHIKNKINNIYRSITIIGEPKIFCISMQRTGTTSVGKFFRDHGFKWSGWPNSVKNRWGYLWRDGNYEKIFNSRDFRLSNAFEDSPWWFPGFYKTIYHRFPTSKFILMERDEASWYKSMCSHSNGNVIGTALGHCKLYRRELEYYKLLDEGIIDEKNENMIGTEKQMKLTNMEEHYKNIYRLHNREVKEFFNQHQASRLCCTQLEDIKKWEKIGNFLGITVSSDYTAHLNKSTRKHK